MEENLKIVVVVFKHAFYMFSLTEVGGKTKFVNCTSRE